jgi:hypothetical protein
MLEDLMLPWQLDRPARWIDATPRAAVRAMDKRISQSGRGRW